MGAEGGRGRLRKGEKEDREGGRGQAFQREGKGREPSKEAKKAKILDRPAKNERSSCKPPRNCFKKSKGPVSGVGSMDCRLHGPRVRGFVATRSLITETPKSRVKEELSNERSRKLVPEAGADDASKSGFASVVIHVIMMTGVSVAARALRFIES